MNKELPSLPQNTLSRPPMLAHRALKSHNLDQEARLQLLLKENETLRHELAILQEKQVEDRTQVTKLISKNHIYCNEIERYKCLTTELAKKVADAFQNFQSALKKPRRQRLDEPLETTNGEVRIGYEDVLSIWSDSSSF